MKHKLFSLLLCLTLVFTLAASASADILWEPIDDSYYNSNYEQCDTVARIYVVPENMTVNLYTAPVGGSLMKTMEAGTRVYVGFRQTVKGEVWGVGYPLGDFDNEGWFRLGRLQREFDHEAFYDTFSETFTAYEDQMAGYVVQDTIYTWTYPGSGKKDGSIPSIDSQYNNGKLECHYVYTDPDGGQWGYVGYYMGRCGWIYLDDPETPDPPLFPQTSENTVTDTSPEEQAPGLGSLWWILGLVAAVVLATAVLVVRMKKRNS